MMMYICFEYILLPYMPMLHFLHLLFNSIQFNFISMSHINKTKSAINNKAYIKPLKHTHYIENSIDMGEKARRPKKGLRIAFLRIKQKQINQNET